MKKILILTILAAGMIPFAAAEETPTEGETPAYELNVYASNWSWDPDIIRVAKGTRVILHVKNMDAPHSFLLKAYRLKVPLPQDETTTVEFVADKAGKFPWRCGRPCGNGCAKMRGTLVVLDPEKQDP
jgi:heme/copper-type cytochrome/quinol oxidase subunit 2